MTNIFFSPTYLGPVYLRSLSGDTVMMDTEAVGLAGLVALLELRLGIHHDDASLQERIICYHDCMKRYLSRHQDSVFSKSFETSALSTAKAVLTWRDELRWTGWNFGGLDEDTSQRLKALADVEESFRTKEEAYDMVDHLELLDRRLTEQNADFCADLTIHLPFKKELMRPKVIELLDRLVDHGAHLQQTPVAEYKDNNLSTVSQLLSGTEPYARKIRLAHKDTDDSLLLWKFPDERAAAEYLSYNDLADVDVWINADNKQMDNWLAVMGRPLTGSMTAECTPQLTQLFVIGVSLFRQTLDINTLMGWLTMPIHPLDRYFRSRLTTTIAQEGGYRNEKCRQCIAEYLDGKYVYLTEEEQMLPEAEQLLLRRKDSKKREAHVRTYLPPMEKPESISVVSLQSFVASMEAWARQRAHLLAEDELLRKEQLLTVADLYKALGILLKNYTEPTLDEHTLTAWVSALYRQACYTNAVAEKGSRIVIDSPSKIVSPVRRTVWLGVEGDTARPLECAFLSPAERRWLSGQPCVVFWSEEQERAYHGQEMLNAFLRTSQQLILVVCERREGEKPTPHPLIVRLEQQVENLCDITHTPNLDAEKTKDIPLRHPKPMEPEIHFQHADLIQWPDHLSPTVLDSLVENPLDFALQYLLHIQAAGEAQAPDLKQTKGNVAHAVIERLFSPCGEDMPTTPAEAAARMKEFDQVYDEQVEAKGGQLQLSEHQLDALLFRSQLRKCVQHLQEIMQANALSVTGCEQLIEGYLPDVDLPKNEAKGDRNLLGFIDMTLEDAEGHAVVFDFKWTSSRYYYPGVLRENRSIQLELYRYLLSHAKKHQVDRVAYFLMPEGRLYSREHFAHVHFQQIEPGDSPQNAYGVNLVEQLRQSIIYRKRQIDGGMLETEGILADKQYAKDTEQDGLFPLEEEYDWNIQQPTGNKKPNAFSDYALLNGKEQ